MKSSSGFQLLNKKEPRIYLEYDLLQQIKYIVKIAPKEAQWFHRLTIDTDGDFCLNEMHIPEQICSSVEVDTDGMMMMRFFKELSASIGMEETNKVFSELNCWCHSHHNMGTSPSGQDVKQFNELVKQSIDQKTNNPVLMLIFNKKDEYYCRAYDPSTGNIYEGLEITVYSKEYEWIDKQAKLKFKEPPPRPVASTFTTATTKSTTVRPLGTGVYSGAYWDNSSVSRPSSTLLDEDIWQKPGFEQASYINNYITSTNVETSASKADSIMKEVFGRSYSLNTKLQKETAQELFEILSEELSVRERYIVMALAKRQTAFFEKAKQANDKPMPKKTWITTLTNLMLRESRDVNYIENLLVVAFDMYDHLETDQLENFTIWADDFYAEQDEDSTYKPFKY
jgi:hypothetical protein